MSDAVLSNGSVLPSPACLPSAKARSAWLSCGEDCVLAGCVLGAGVVGVDPEPPRNRNTGGPLFFSCLSSSRSLSPERSRSRLRTFMPTRGFSKSESRNDFLSGSEFTSTEALLTVGDPKEKLMSRSNDWSSVGESNCKALFKREPKMWSEVTGVARSNEPVTSDPGPESSTFCAEDGSSAPACAKAGAKKGNTARASP